MRAKHSEAVRRRAVRAKLVEVRRKLAEVNQAGRKLRPVIQEWRRLRAQGFRLFMRRDALLASLRGQVLCGRCRQAFKAER